MAALLRAAQPGLEPGELVHRIKATGKWIQDPANGVWTPRVDARVAFLTNDNLDYDQDGCSNGKEFGSNPAQGGQRNPLDEWDFYDVTGMGGVKDGQVSLTYDILGVIFRWTPNPSLPYDAAYDRGETIGPNSWNKAEPDGRISLTFDILGVILQWLHNCN